MKKKNLNCIFEFSLSLSVLQWASVLSRVALEQERVLPVLLDLLRTNSDLELRSLTGFLRNLSRHAKDKNDMGKSLFFSMLGISNSMPLTHLIIYNTCIRFSKI